MLRFFTEICEFCTVNLGTFAKKIIYFILFELHMRSQFEFMAGYSCEPGRRRAYHEDLRWRMVWQHAVQGFSLQTVAFNLSVDPSTVHRITKQFELSGQVHKKKYSCVNHSVKKLSKSVQFTVLQFMLQRPGIYLKEIQQELLWQFGLHISESSLCNFLKKSNFTRKKCSW